MAQRYKVVERKNLGKDKTEVPKKFYAVPVNNGYVSFKELCDEIAENCTLTSADVKATMIALNQYRIGRRITQQLFKPVVFAIQLT